MSPYLEGEAFAPHAPQTVVFIQPLSPSFRMASALALRKIVQDICRPDRSVEGSSLFKAMDSFTKFTDAHVEFLVLVVKLRAAPCCGRREAGCGQCLS